MLHFLLVPVITVSPNVTLKKKYEINDYFVVLKTMTT